MCTDEGLTAHRVTGEIAVDRDCGDLGPKRGAMSKLGTIAKGMRMLFIDRSDAAWMAVQRAEFAAHVRLPMVSLAEIAGAAGDVVVPQPSLKGEGVGDPNYYYALGAIARALQPRTILEIGTYLGMGALTFALNTRSECRIYTIDLPEDEFAADSDAGDRQFVEKSRGRVGSAWQSYPPETSGKIVQLRGDSRTIGLDEVGHPDLIFIDGGHSYDIVKSDTERALSILAPGGAMLWDDYGMFWQDDVVRYLDGLSESLEMVRLEGTDLVVHLRDRTRRGGGR